MLFLSEYSPNTVQIRASYESGNSSRTTNTFLHLNPIHLNPSQVLCNSQQTLNPVINNIKQSLRNITGGGRNLHMDLQSKRHKSDYTELTASHSGHKLGQPINQTNRPAVLSPNQTMNPTSDSISTVYMNQSQP